MIPVNVITRRISAARDIGNSVGLTLRPELEDMKIKPGDEVAIILTEDEHGTRRITIEAIAKKK